jgi:hypothetical protein
MLLEWKLAVQKASMELAILTEDGKLFQSQIVRGKELS